MFRRFRFYRNAPITKRLLLDVNSSSPPAPRRVKPAMLDTLQEIAIYIHRFHNLDLFQQGWYQIKITMRWEDSKYTSPGTPARVVQYEAPDLGPDNVFGVWRIDDTDNSFCTQPFRVKYARQDVLLSTMISFNLSFSKHEGPSMSAVILKFELLYNPVLEKGSDLQASPDSNIAAVHEFRIPSKALLGLHSYCPVHFDTFHAVLVELSVHVSLLKGDTCTPSSKVLSDSGTTEGAGHETFGKDNQITGQGSYLNPKSVAFMKAMLTARDILLDELHHISKAINQTIDLTDISSSNLGDNKVIGSIILATANAEASEVRIGARQVTSEPQNGFQIVNGSIDFESDGVLQAVSTDEMLDGFHSLGNQISFLWNTFLKFHRANTTKILEFLRDTWANDRRAEWSIWMVYSKVEMPHHYLRSGLDESSHHSARGKNLMSRKLNDDPARTAMTRAERHRRSIAQMRINNRSIQDMHIFGEPLRIPVILVDRVVNVPLRSTSGNSYFSALDNKDTPDIHMSTGIKDGRLSGASAQQTGRVLKIVVFVHGFQGHHLDLRLVRNQWLLIDPGVDCLMSEVNEDRTSGDFREMGARLAEEVTSFIKKKMDKVSRSGGYRNIKLSFVGHSIGNVILRTALTESRMEPFLKYLYTYLSISGPHLGYLYSSNSLFNSGLWLLKKLKGSQCIHQLTFTDQPDLENTFFYRLCKQKTLEHFKNIILLSSPQDGYVPYHSARIEMCQASSWDSSKKGKIFTEMLNDCLDQIRTPSSEQRMFVRCDVNFDTSTQGRNLNTMIGRAAHIEFLETDVFARFIMWSFPELFR